MLIRDLRLSVDPGCAAKTLFYDFSYDKWELYDPT